MEQKKENRKSQNTKKIFVAALGLGAVAIMVVSWGVLQGNSSMVPALKKNNEMKSSQNTDGENWVVGEIKGKPIYFNDLSMADKVQINEVKQQYFQVMYQVVANSYMESFFEEYRKEKNISSTNLAREQYMNAQKVDVSDDEVKQMYERYKDQLGNYTQEQAFGLIKNQIVGEQRNNSMRELISKAYSEGLFTLSVKEPVALMYEVDDGGNEGLGPKDAKVQIIEFAEFECPYCERGYQNLKQVMAKYKDVRWVFRDMPLDFHANAIPSAIAANCGGAQGKYFDFHHALFDGGAQNLNDANYRKIAENLKLDMGKFEECLKDPAIKEEILRDVQVGKSLGVNGTPAYFINGKLYSGAIPIERLEQAIEEARKR